jgi:multidrug efflux pump subunit AcrA (membrane-fusion protein)
LQGTVHSLLPAASTGDLSVNVRIDLQLTGPLAIGLFGTADIEVGQAPNAVVVPQAAVLRDDLTGTQRVAVVDHDKVHWQDVTSGVRSGGWVEVPALTPGSQVVIEGQVGLPEGAPVVVSP